MAQKKKSFGFAIIWNGHILLQHATRASWTKTYSITKGEQEGGEFPLNTAIREFEEETGHKLNPILYKDKSRLAFDFEVENTTKELKGWFITISHPGEIGINEDTLIYPKSNLQDAEIDWCGFVNFEEAKKRMAPYQLPILEKAMAMSTAEVNEDWFTDEAIEFIPVHQLNYLKSLPKKYLSEIVPEIKRLNEIIAQIPKTYETEDVSDVDKKVWLHYFSSNSDWYIIEKDSVIGEPQIQAYGIANLNNTVPGLGEYGYINIEELRNIPQVEIDFHFTPRTVAQLKAKKQPTEQPVIKEVVPTKQENTMQTSSGKIMPKLITLQVRSDRDREKFSFYDYAAADSKFQKMLKDERFSDMNYTIEFSDGFELEGVIDCEPRSRFEGVSNPLTRHLTYFWPNLAEKNHKPSHPEYLGSKFAKQVVDKYYLGGDNELVVKFEKLVPPTGTQTEAPAHGGADLSKIIDSQTQHIPYVPVSNNCRFNLGTVIPKGMAAETYSALISLNKKLIETYGLDLDGYVQSRLMFQPQELGLSKSEFNALSQEEKDKRINAAMCDLLAPEQVDALALAMFNIESRGQGMIVGDMTGIGKGRIAAALIRYSIMYLKKTPIFLTEKGYLFSDIYRDLQDISADPLIPLKIKSGDRIEEIKFTKSKIAQIIKERKENGDSDEEAQEYVDALIDAGGQVVKSVYVPNKNYEKDVTKLNKKILRIVPFILNDRNEGNSIKCMSANPERDKHAEWTTAKDGDIIYEALANTSGIFQSALRTGKLPKGYNMLMATYSQISNAAISKKMKFFQEIAKNNIVICDESHNASGQSNTGTFVMNTLKEALGACFLSATYAKRPDNMAIYASKTCMSESNLDANGIAEAISRGGVPLQEIISSQLVAEGQMVRRERTFAGVDIRYNVMDSSMATQGFDFKDKHSAISNIFTELLRDVIDVQNNVLKPILTGKAAGGKDYIKAILADEMGVSDYTELEIPKEFSLSRALTSSPIFSKVFNVINQLLFSIKSEAIAERAIEYMREGKKPVIAFSNTMESFLDTVKNEEGELAGEGDTISTDFKLILERLIDNLQYVSIKKPDGTVSRKKMPLEELPPAVSSRIERLREKMKSISVGICISPIDVILHKIREAGFTVEEVTGRETRIDFEGDPTFMTGKLRKQPKPIATKVFLAFNQNKVDCVLINQSGAVGASIHAKPNSQVNHVLYQLESGERVSMPWNPKTMDASRVCVPASLEPRNEIKQRKMLSLQPELDINKEVQKRGRIMRSGQLILPGYEYLSSAIPAEQRLQMMMKKKLESLDANTSANQKKSDSLIGAVDFLNKYGDEVVIKYLKENQPLNKIIGDPLGMIKDGLVVEVSPEKKINAAHKVTGRVAILSISDQEKFYQEVSQNYIAYIADLKSSDQYDAEVEYYDLQSQTLDRDILIVGSGGSSLFGRNTIIEHCEVNNLRKPYTRQEIKTMLEERLLDFQDYSNPAKELQKSLINKLNAYFTEKRAKIDVEYEEINKDAIDKLERDKKLLRLAKKDPSEAKKLLELYKKSTLEENAIRKADELANMDNRRDYVRNFLGKLRIGQATNYKNGEYLIPAVILDIAIDFNAWNPFTPSNIRLKTAIANGLRVITTSFSNDIQINEFIANMQDDDESESVINRWDKITKESVADRVKRYIACGNLLQAMSDPDVYSGGRLIKFTTNDNKIRTGYLMPMEYNPSQSGRGSGGRYVMLPLKHAFPILELLDVKRKTVNITSDNIEFSRAENDIDYVIKVEKGNKSNIITQDPTILALLDNDKGFSDYGRISVYNPSKKENKDVSAMGARVEDEKMPELLNYLFEKYGSMLRVPKSVFDTMKRAISVDFTTEYDDSLNTELDESGLSAIKIDINDPSYQRIVSAQMANDNATVEIVEEEDEIVAVEVTRPEEMKEVTEPSKVRTEFKLDESLITERDHLEFDKTMFKLLKMLYKSTKKMEKGGELNDKSVKKMFDVYSSIGDYLGSVYVDPEKSVEEAIVIAKNKAATKFSTQKNISVEYVGEQGVMFVEN